MNKQADDFEPNTGNAILDILHSFGIEELCFAAFCLGVGIGWRKDVPAAARFYGAALAEGYERAAYYLNEIRAGRV